MVLPYPINQSIITHWYSAICPCLYARPCLIHCSQRHCAHFVNVACLIKILARKCQVIAVLVWNFPYFVHCWSVPYSLIYRKLKCHSSVLIVLAESLVHYRKILTVANKYDVNCLNVSVSDIKNCVWKWLPMLLSTLLLYFSLFYLPAFVYRLLQIIVLQSWPPLNPARLSGEHL